MYIFISFLLTTAAEAEKYHAERKQIAQKIQARNEFEDYAYNLRSSLQVSISHSESLKTSSIFWY